MTATARRRRLARLTDAGGSLRVLALDHRDSLRAVLAPDGGDPPGDDALRALKADLVGALDGHVSGVMLDPALGMHPDVLGLVPPTVGVIAALEAQGYLADDSVTHTTLLPDWGVGGAAAAGADAVKLLVLWTGDPHAPQRAVVDAAVADARAHGLPLVLEPLPRGLPPTGPWVLDWVRAHADAGADVLKLPHPGSAAACEEVTATTDAPWVLLSAGAGFEEFREQLAAAMAAGAAGYIVGRAVWREAATPDPGTRATAIEELVLPRLDQLARVGA